MPRSPRKGDIYRFRDGGTIETKPRPLLVLSRVELNGSKYLLVATFTSKKLDVRIGRKQFVLFERGEFGLTERCVLQLDAVSRVEFSEINTADGVIGRLTSDRLAAVDSALRYVFDL